MQKSVSPIRPDYKRRKWNDHNFKTKQDESLKCDTHIYYGLVQTVGIVILSENKVAWQ